MSTPQFGVAIDLGTTSLKVGLVSFAGDVVWSDVAPCHTAVLPGGGREQDPGEWWSTICSMIRSGMASGAVRRIQAGRTGIVRAE